MYLVYYLLNVPALSLFISLAAYIWCSMVLCCYYPDDWWFTVIFCFIFFFPLISFINQLVKEGKSYWLLVIITFQNRSKTKACYQRLFFYLHYFCLLIYNILSHIFSFLLWQTLGQDRAIPESSDRSDTSEDLEVWVLMLRSQNYYIVWWWKKQGQVALVSSNQKPGHVRRSWSMCSVTKATWCSEFQRQFWKFKKMKTIRVARRYVRMSGTLSICDIFACVQFFFI